jgi:hypothetical protein
MSDIADFYRGDTKKYKLVVKSKDSGEAISVDGGKLYFTLKKSQSQTDDEAALQIVADGTETDPLTPEGIVYMTVPASDTKTLTPGDFYYDFQFVSASGEVTTVLAGKVKVMKDTTLTDDV